MSNKTLAGGSGDRDGPHRVTSARSKTLTQAIRVLGALDGNNGRGVRETAAALKMSRSTVHRILATFEDWGIVQFDSRTESYSLGPALLALVASERRTNPLVRAAQPVMEELSEATQETVELSILVRCQRMTLCQVESHEDLRFASREGRLYPIHAGSTGRVLLSLLDDGDLTRCLANITLDPLAPNTITDRSQLLASVRRARDEGFAVSIEEGIAGAAGCSVPIDAGYAGQAAIGIYGPAARFTPEIVETYRHLLKQAASRIEDTLLAYRRT